MKPATFALKTAIELRKGDLIMDGNMKAVENVVASGDTPETLCVTVFFSYGSNRYKHDQKVLIVIEG